MVDRVELVLVHQPPEMRELHRDRAGRLQEDAEAVHEAVQIGNVGEDVVPDDEVGLPPVGRQLPRQLRSEESLDRGNPPFDRARRHVRRRLDSEDGNPARREVLQEVPVVAGDFDDPAAGAETEPLRHPIGIGLRVPHPRLRVGGEVGVFRKDLRGGDVLPQLDQEASRADPDVKREERLHLVEPIGGHVAFAQGRHPEVGEGPGERRPAEPAERSRPGSRAGVRGHSLRPGSAAGAAMGLVLRRSRPRTPERMSSWIWSIRRYRGPSNSSSRTPVRRYAS